MATDTLAHFCCHDLQIVVMTDLCAKLLHVYFAANQFKVRKCCGEMWRIGESCVTILTGRMNVVI